MHECKAMMKISTRAARLRLQRLEFHGGSITSDAGLSASRELGDASVLSEIADKHFRHAIRLPPNDILRRESGNSLPRPRRIHPACEAAVSRALFAAVQEVFGSAIGSSALTKCVQLPESMLMEKIGPMASRVLKPNGEFRIALVPR
jgi:hypothetical protein